MRGSFVCLTALALASSACVTNAVGVERNSLPVQLHGLYDRAQQGDKLAQFELAIAFADGVLVERNCERADRLLGLAAADSGGKLWVYSPPVGNGTSGRVIPLDQGPKQSGLLSAKQMLADPNFCNNS